jgi:hypothetical protein
MPDELLSTVILNAPTVGALLYMVYRYQSREDGLVNQVIELARICAKCADCPEVRQSKD